MPGPILRLLDLVGPPIVRLSDALTDVYIDKFTPYKAGEPPGDRSGHEQEEDTRYSPRGLRDREYRTYIGFRTTALVFGLLAVALAGLLVALVSITGLTVGTVVVAYAILPAAALSLGVAVISWNAVSDYPSSRRIDP